jgi:membrane fusion protein (multidrug efflux system)
MVPRDNRPLGNVLHTRLIVRGFPPPLRHCGKAMKAFPLVACVAAGLCAPLAALAQQPSVPTVGVITAEKRPVTQGQTFVGRVEAVERVDIRARVTGYLDEVLFRDGQKIKRGDALYRIEKAPFEATLAQSKASVVRMRAQLDNATMQRERADTLVKTSAVSEATRDDRVAAEKSAQGDLAAAEAQQQSAEINLAYTDITSPIAGEIGRSAVTRGNVVGPESGVLSTIVSVEPMYVTFPVSQREFLRYAEQRGNRPANPGEYKIVVHFSNGQAYPHSGKIDFVDVKVDRATDTINVRATIPNPDGMLVDGQLVQVSVEGEKPEERVLIPQVALIADQQGAYVFVVDDGKLAIRRLKLGQARGTAIIVTDGLSGGEQVVLGSAMGLRPGIPVNAVPAEKPMGG